MKKLALIGPVALMCFTAFAADPELKGTATELAQFLNGVIKTATITADAEVRVPAHRAVLTLRVITESRSLQEALRANLDLRGKVSDQLKKQGIPADRVQGSRFSSTPKFGMFGEKAKSYRVENMLRVAVQDEREFHAAAGPVDLWSEVQFGGVEFEYADKEASKAKAVSQACDTANERRRLYEEKFGLKLTPVRFSEGDVAQLEAGPFQYGAYGQKDRALETTTGIQTSPSFSKVEGMVSSFGELVYIARVTVEYSVQAK